jgi:hypothetical protein
MNFVVEADFGGVIFILGFIKIGSGIKKLIRGSQ